MTDTFVLGPAVDHIDPDSWYSIGRDEPRGPWAVLSGPHTEGHAARLDAASPAAVRYGTLGTRRGADILSALTGPVPHGEGGGGPWNPRYVAYATAHGRGPAAMLAYDTERYPGGKMAGFMGWIGQQLSTFRKVHPEAFLLSPGEPGRLVDQDAFTVWCEAVGRGTLVAERERPGDTIRRLLGHVPVVFGLQPETRAEVERMLAGGWDWPAIGQAVGWDPATLREHFERTP